VQPITHTQYWMTCPDYLQMYTIRIHKLISVRSIYTLHNPQNSNERLDEPQNWSGWGEKKNPDPSWESNPGRLDCSPVNVLVESLNLYSVE
jgi:hypothetical protein